MLGVSGFGSASEVFIVTGRLGACWGGFENRAKQWRMVSDSAVAQGNLFQSSRERAA